MFMNRNETKYPLEKGVPIQPPKYRSKYNFRDMAVGDTFLAEGSRAEAGVCPAYGAAKSYQYRNPGVKFSGIKAGPNQVLIGRIE